MRHISSFRCSTLSCACLLLMLIAVPAQADQPPLRVCADPNNMPFSNQDGQGFENRIAELMAEELGKALEYTWWAQRRGFLRNTLYANECDVVIGVPSSLELVTATRPYYRASYMFVTRQDQQLEIESFDDPQLHELAVGVHLIGDDYSNTPPAHALANRGIIDNVTGFMIYGDYGKPDPTAALIDAVAAGDIEVAIAWGPQARYFSSKADVPLRTEPVKPLIDKDGMTFTYSISMGVRLNDLELKRELDDVLVRRKDDIEAILAEYHVVDGGG